MVAGMGFRELTLSEVTQLGVQRPSSAIGQIMDAGCNRISGQAVNLFAVLELIFPAMPVNPVLDWRRFVSIQRGWIDSQSEIASIAVYIGIPAGLAVSMQET